MWLPCLECGLVGCGCDQIKGRVKFKPRNDEKELEKWRLFFLSDDNIDRNH